eukprot:gene6427-10435_t
MVQREDWIKHCCEYYDISYQISTQTNFEREFIIEELLEKEILFLKLFNYFIKTYYIPIVTLKIKILPNFQQQELFIPGLLNIYYFINHQKSILNQLKKETQKEDSKIEIGKLMILSLPLFQIFGSYFQLYKQKLIKFYQLKYKFRKFSNFLRDIQENDVNLEGRSYEDLISMPFQRLCHYELFLEKLNSKTPFSHMDKINLCLSVLEIKKLKEKFNAKVDKSKRKNILFKMKKTISIFICH